MSRSARRWTFGVGFVIAVVLAWIWSVASYRTFEHNGPRYETTGPMIHPLVYASEREIRWDESRWVPSVMSCNYWQDAGIASTAIGLFALSVWFAGLLAIRDSDREAAAEDGQLP